MTDLVVYDIGELVVGPSVASETDSVLDSRANAAIVIAEGTVIAVGDSESVCKEYPPGTADRAIDARGRLVTPGLVDPHTHALFAGDRSGEFLARIEGQSYTEIARAGGGIPVTVEAVRSASDETLLRNLLTQLDVMLAHGTTTAEVKSGYGLDVESELRMLDGIARANERHPVDLIPTFMGAHAVPSTMETDAYVDHVVTDQLPAVAAQGIAQFCDVFCEEGVFSVAQSRRILEAGREHGLAPKIHAEEFSRIGGAALAADLGAASADHLLQATDEDIDTLAAAGVTPVLLPATAFSLSEPYAEARRFLEAGAPVALGTDLNPSCFVHSMGMVLSLACLRMGMRPDEAILGGTARAMRALRPTPDEPVGRVDRTEEPARGTLREGAPADLVVFDLPTHVHLPANAGTNRVQTVVKDGTVVHRAGRGGTCR